MAIASAPIEDTNSRAKRDFPMIQGIVLFIAVIYVVVNLVVDILYGFIDPRIKYN